MLLKRNLTVIYIVLFLLFVFELKTEYIKSSINYIKASENSLVLNIVNLNSGFDILCADGINSYFILASLSDKKGNKMPYNRLKMSVDEGNAIISPKTPVTNKNGQVLIRITPIHENYTSAKSSFQLTIKSKKSQPVIFSGLISSPPVLLIHGFNATSFSMAPLKAYLLQNDFPAYTFDYDTDDDLNIIVQKLHNKIRFIQSDMQEKGYLVNKIDTVSHSLGGIIIRIYTTNIDYLSRQNIRKSVFITVPHHGTPWGEIGADLLNDPFLKELYPNSSLFKETLHNAINFGLNYKIQTSNIVLYNDEVVPIESALLNEWGIKSKIFQIGDEKPTIDKIINFSDNPYHQQVLFYIPVLEEVRKNLVDKLPYPIKKQR